MFDYFTTTKKLDNLLWVYAPNHGDKVAAYYPGDRFADVVGLDAYTDFVDPAHIRGYRELAAIPSRSASPNSAPTGPPIRRAITTIPGSWRRHRRAFPQDCLLPRLAWQVGPVEEPQRQGPARQTRDHQSRGPAARPSGRPLNVLRFRTPTVTRPLPIA